MFSNMADIHLESIIQQREDGQRVEDEMGTVEWRLDGRLHRLDDKPAHHSEDGMVMEWWVDGKRHRIGGPAVISQTSYQWWKNDMPHREDGPAIEDLNGAKEWLVDGKRHREDGPAIDGINEPEWWVNDVRLTYEQFSSISQLTKRAL